MGPCFRLVIARWETAPEGSTWEAINKAWVVLATLAEYAESQDLAGTRREVRLTTVSTSAQCASVLEQLERMYGKQPYFKAVRLGKDDGGLHVDLVVARDRLPPEGAPLVGVVLQVKVCTVVVG